MLYRILTIILIALTSISAQSFLSSLEVTKDDPLYTMYAAHKDRSEFILDEGYQFRWWVGDEPLSFTTDNGGTLGYAWKKDETIVYELEDYYQEPIVTLSFPDMVRFTCYPFEHLKVEETFFVYSSRIVIREINITNEGSETVSVGYYPLMMYDNDSFSDVSFVDASNAFTFQHQESPDWWTTGHNVPYQENIKDVLLFSEAPDFYGAYDDISKKRSKDNVNDALANYCVEWGTVHYSNGELCHETPPDAQQMIYHNNSLDEILTETAPKWGDADPNIPGNGYQGCELGNFRNPPIEQGDAFTVLFYEEKSGEYGINTGTIPGLPGSVNLNIQLEESSRPEPPANFIHSFSQDSASVVLTWEKKDGLVYHVYRRSYLTPGRYDRIATSLTGGMYWDMDYDKDSLYAYVVLAEDESGSISGHSRESASSIVPSSDLFSDIADGELYNTIPTGSIEAMAFQKNISLEAGQSKQYRTIRGVTEAENAYEQMIDSCVMLLDEDFESYIQQNITEYSQIPEIEFDNPDFEHLYYNAYSLIKQCMLPPEGECSYNYYVFSREPQWGWGHGGQVFHESLVMLAYVMMNPQSAMNSQRIYIERQYDNGYINYRTGPYLNETIPTNGQLTTSAPWFNWINLELYKVTGDVAFLQEAYTSGVKFYNYWIANRDADGDGLSEWGAHAVLECVRDGQVAVWDQVGWPSNFEGLDLNCMLVNEANSLSEMATILGYTDEAAKWKSDADIRAYKINEFTWDEETGFYYNVDKNDGDFTYQNHNDLKRKEIIGFLPMWANVASEEQAERLVQYITNTNEFGRPFGIPSLSAADPYYNPKGYWNGPAWPQWQFLVTDGLLNYRYVEEATELTERVAESLISQLKDNHYFWEFYSPDTQWGGWHKTYIWTGIIAKMLYDIKDELVGIEGKKKDQNIEDVILGQYPNPTNSSVTIKYQVSKPAPGTMILYNSLGKIVRTHEFNAMNSGENILRLSLRDLASGTYFYRMQCSDEVGTGKIILLK